jgi:hypothetical protein
MHFLGERLLPGSRSYPDYLDRIRAYLHVCQECRAQDLLERFLGFRAPAVAFHIVGVDHVAVYLGDYVDEGQVEDWVDFLEDGPRLQGISVGPSHIAPRQYGTPGYWISGRLDGIPCEMFTCKSTPAWSARDDRQVVALMSHFALAVSAAEHVRPVLSYLAHYPGVRELAFASEDALGHTYGHLIREDTSMVLELVHDPNHHLCGDYR